MRFFIAWALRLPPLALESTVHVMQRLFARIVKKTEWAKKRKMNENKTYAMNSKVENARAISPNRFRMKYIYRTLPFSTCQNGNGHVTKITYNPFSMTHTNTTHMQAISQRITWFNILFSFAKLETENNQRTSTGDYKKHSMGFARHSIRLFIFILSTRLK